MQVAADLRAKQIAEEEAGRVAAVRALGLLDTEPEERFDRITRLAAQIMGVRMALIALIDADRAWCKSAVGLSRISIPRELTICALATTPGEVLEILDAARLPATAHNPLVTGEPGIRFFAAVPLFSPEGYRIGSLSVFDPEPRSQPMPPVRKQGLLDLSAMATEALAPRILIEQLSGKCQQAEDTLLESVARFHAVARATGDVVWDWDLTTGHIWWNENFQTCFGYGPGELEPHIETWSRCLHPEDRERIETEVEAFITGREEIWRGYYRFRRKNGSYADVFDCSFLLRDAAGRGTRMICALQDITERKEAEERLRERTALVEALVESAPDGLLVVDRQRNRVVQNRRMAELWKIPPEVVADPDNGRQFDFVARQAKNPQEFIEKVTHLNAHPDEISHGVIELVDGTILERYSAPAIDAAGRYYGRIWAFRDITERKHSEDRIRYLATHDELTGLPNRTLVEARLADALAQARRLDRHAAVLYVDLDRFKIVNDAYGHAFGDAVLKAASERIAALARDSDTVARMSGDEFLVVLTHLHQASDASVIARKILDAFVAPLMADGREVFLSVSIGISRFPHDGDTVEALIGSADLAMYRAKELGRNSWQSFTHELDEKTRRYVSLEIALRRAVTKQLFALVYQPKVSLDDGRIIGAEALIRWCDPEWGVISPAEFIPIAEDSGLIGPISEWVLRTACAQAKAWLDSGLPPVTVAVNISARQFLQQNVVSWVTGTLQATGLPPPLLELELTESLLAQDTKNVIATLGTLSDAGVQLSIDDFGTGYSSLGYLKHFPVDTLKIDQSFVRDMLANPDDAAIVRATIALAHNLGFRVIAEGVESAEHCRVLRENRCDEIQGYYFSKPLQADAFAAIVRADKRLAVA